MEEIITLIFRLSGQLVEAIALLHKVKAAPDITQNDIQAEIKRIEAAQKKVEGEEWAIVNSVEGRR